MNSTKPPQKVLFLLTSMPVGGAETLLVNLTRSFDTDRIDAEVCCLKARGPLGEQLNPTIPVHANMIRHKYDILVVWRLLRLMRRGRYDAVITVGAGDNMFWGRIAAYLARVPFIGSAIHSTGWPDGIGRLNRMLTPLNDAFIAVAEAHGEFLRQSEGLPHDRVVVIPNGVDTDRFKPDTGDRDRLRQDLRLPLDAPICCIVAALRPEKNHARFLRIASEVRKDHHPNAHFLIVGDGTERATLASYASELQIDSSVHFLGSRNDIDRILPACDAFMLTSENEANPVSIMEAMACGLPVLAPAVGSIDEVVTHGVTGFVIPKTDESQFAESLGRVLTDTSLGSSMGAAGRKRILEVGSIQSMVDGYQHLIENAAKRGSRGGAPERRWKFFPYLRRQSTV